METHAVLIIIPALNEERTLSSVIHGVRQALPMAHILVVNDGSTDQTRHVAKTAGAVVVNHPYNLGYGTALQTGFKYALHHGFPLIAHLDGDGQHPPSALPQLLDIILQKKADVAIGSRVLHSHSYRMPLFRRLGSKVFALLTSFITQQRVTDPTSGMQALNLEAVRFYSSHVFPVDYPDADMLITLHRTGFRFQEIPVAMLPPQKGRSMHQGLRPLYYLFKVGLSILVSLLRRDRHQGKLYAPSTADLRAHS